MVSSTRVEIHFMYLRVWIYFVLSLFSLFDVYVLVGFGVVWQNQDKTHFLLSLARVVFGQRKVICILSARCHGWGLVKTS